jgi:hypothetical protein
MKKGLFKNLLKWQNYVHYLLLTAALFVIHWLTGVNGYEAAAAAGGIWAWTKLFLFYAFGFLVADTAIHIMFALLPEPYKWED